MSANSGKPMRLSAGAVVKKWRGSVNSAPVMLQEMQPTRISGRISTAC
jgi:hypothetical protein